MNPPAESLSLVVLIMPIAFALLLGALNLILPIQLFTVWRLPGETALAGLGWDVWAATEARRSSELLTPNFTFELVLFVAFVHFILFALGAQLSHVASSSWAAFACQRRNCNAKNPPSAKNCSNCGKVVDQSNHRDEMWKARLLFGSTPFVGIVTFSLPVAVVLHSVIG